MSSEGIRGDDDSPKRSRRGLSRRDKRRERTNQWRLNKSLDKLSLIPSQGIDKFDEPQCEPKGLSHFNYVKERKKRRKLNRSLSKLELGCGLDVEEPEPTDNQQNIQQIVHEKREYTQSTNSIGAVEDGNDNSVNGIGAFSDSEPAARSCKEPAPSKILPAKMTRPSVYMDNVYDQYPIIQSRTMIKVTNDPSVAADISHYSTVTDQVNIHGV